MKQQMNRICACCMLWAATALLSSCGTDEVKIGDNSVGRETRVMITLQLPPQAMPQTYALSPADENEIKVIDVLSFRADASKPSGWAFDYNTQGASIANTGETDQHRKQFAVTLIKDLAPQTFVVLANARDEIAGLEQLAKGADKDELLVRLVSSHIGKRDANEVGSENDPTKAFVPFPMWGEATTTVTDATTEVAVNMLRSTVRVDVVLGDNVVAAGNFKLDEIRIYNSKNRGHIVPAPANLSGGKAVSATVPQGDINNASALIYSVPAAMDKAFERSVYLFEAKAAKPGEAAKATAIVVGGTYGDDTSPSYYRLDFLASDRKTYKDILRNHLYRFNIVNVTGRGRVTADEAFNSAPNNMVVDILEWNDGDVGDIVFDGQYYLGVSPADVTLHKDAKAGNSLTVVTDVPGGWTITGATDSPRSGGKAVSWIRSISGAFTASGSKDTVTFDVEENKTGVLRVGYIHIKAGRISFAVKVTQDVVSDMSMRITDISGSNDLAELVFSSMIDVQPDAQQFRLQWTPANAEVSVNKVSFLSGVPEFTYDVSYNTPGAGGATSISNLSGEQVFTIRPATLTSVIDLNPFIENASKVDFLLFSGSNYILRSIILRQINFCTMTDVAESYPLNGSSYSFTIRSNTKWAVKQGSVSDPDGILDPKVDLLSQRGGPNTLQGNTFNFKLVNDVDGTKNGKTATFYLTDPTNRMKDVLVTIKGCHCGINGFAVVKKIGNNSYLTHMYGDKCWMVENSREGTYSGRGYGLDASGNDIGTLNFKPRGTVNGYYYTWDNAASACPDGWHLPSKAEFGALTNLVNFRTGDKAKWWSGLQGSSNGAFAGYYRTDFSNWYDWGDYGYWWCSGSNQNFSGFIAGLAGPFSNSNSWFSVRCIQD